MSGLVESAAAIMSGAERRLSSAANNIANISTSGYKRRISFDVLVGQDVDGVAEIATRRDLAPGKLQMTGNPFDFAITGAGYFRVRGGEAILYTRQGHFRRDPDGLLVTAQGHVLQQAGGGDMVVRDASATVATDGTVMEDGRPVARIAVARAGDEGALVAVGDTFYSAGATDMREVEDVAVRQGAVEASNVAIGDEMVQSMAALRQAERGARLIQLYDDLMGRAVTAFGGGGR